MYDFGCQLHEFALNRDPEYFALTRFTVRNVLAHPWIVHQASSEFGLPSDRFCFFTVRQIDRYHEYNHSPYRCSRAHFLSSYPDQQGLNSQACEHFNAFLEEHMKGRTEMYNKQNFLNTVRLLVRVYNAAKLEKLRKGGAGRRGTA